MIQQEFAFVLPELFYMIPLLDDIFDAFQAVVHKEWKPGTIFIHQQEMKEDLEFYDATN